MIGAGGMAGSWIRTLTEQFGDRVRIVGLVDVDADVLEQQSDRLGLGEGQTFSDIDTALKEFHTEEGPVVTSEGRMRLIAEGLGCGLSAVQRLMCDVSILSRPGRGTIVRAIKSIDPCRS